jgi:Fe(3+) dicitrate transport protein
MTHLTNNSMMTLKTVILSVVLSLSLSTNLKATDSAYAVDSANNEAKENKTSIEHVEIIGRKSTLRKEAGSATLIDELTLEKFEFDDIHRVLANVPGVNIRQEDGYGLRPNIGFRGVTPERSKKINILEDGVLIGPAPYSAPAAYYFPSVNRMTSVEVVKGPAAIKFGPNTVAGTLNMTTRAVPDYLTGHVDLSMGSNGYQKFQGYVGDQVTLGNDEVGYLIEGGTYRADGFKDIDNADASLFDPDSGFSKYDLIFKANYLNTLELFGLRLNQTFELKAGIAHEDSNETYLGLSDQDFAQTPYRRYAASQVANMTWDHQQLQFTHRLNAQSFNITNRLYHHEFSRAWRKVNGFQSIGVSSLDRSLQEIIAAPDQGINQDYYRILTGQQDTVGRNESLIVGTNDRSYVSKGIQSDLNWVTQLFGVSHLISTGVRLHHDRIDRDHFAQNFQMLSGVMTPDQQGPKFTTIDYEQTDAVSVYLSDTVTLGRLDVTFGSRGEFLDSRYQNEKTDKADNWLEKQTQVWLYSASAFYTANESLGIFIGAHEGFVPTSPKQAAQIKPESSINYEFGVRFNQEQTQLEAVLFHNDFDNLKESCSFSTSASCVTQAQLDQEYNGGEVDVFGLELNLQRREYLTDAFDMPWSIVYTHTDSEFKHSFESTFELWGNITEGDALPYLPKNQLTVNLGLESSDWQISLMIKYVDQMPEATGDDVPLSGLVTDQYTVVDVSANYQLSSQHVLYAKIDNLLEETALVSRRPYGARPSKPQQFFIGYKYTFE